MILMNPVCLFSFLYCLISHSGCHLAPSSTGMWHLRHSPGFSFTLSFENPLCSAIGLFHDNPPDVRNVWPPHNQAGFYPCSWLASRQAGWSLQGVVMIQIPLFLLSWHSCLQVLTDATGAAVICKLSEEEEAKDEENSPELNWKVLTMFNASSGL